MTASEICHRMQIMYWETWFKQRTAIKWSAQFWSGRQSTLDLPRPEEEPESIPKQFLVFPLGSFGSPALQFGSITFRVPRVLSVKEGPEKLHLQSIGL
ncbi:hypothetical protein AVEN_53210-1 [Araneus ventricosus]|uniref:Uncharacterized protein n=1 Tax=Araneus ventricosus TaxID=182803 RepID=A0A4Y2AA55_ARAVE|nr:hypothetical protein AVEN_53210-1 [Araneus ventricosus]